MKKGRKILIVAVALISFVLIGTFVAYFVKSHDEKIEQKEEQEAEQERLEVLEKITKAKEVSYSNYIRGIENHIDSKEYSDVLRVAELSDYYLYRMDLDENTEFYVQTEKGNEYLEKLKEATTENLNESISYLLSSSDADDSYNKIKYFDTLESEFVTVENLELLKEAEDRYNEREAIKEAEREANKEEIARDRARAESILKSRVQTGMSKSEVTGMIGLPKDKFKTEEAEFWVYGNMVLTMKNGFVFQINNND